MSIPISHPATQPTPVPASASQRERWWREQWLAFPTVAPRDDGGFDFWAVEPDTGVYQDDWPRGERLARDTIAHMQAFPEGSSVLRRILRDMEHDSTVAQGFLNHLEEALAHPQTYLVAPPALLPEDTAAPRQQA